MLTPWYMAINNWTECNDFDFIPYSVRMNHERL